MKFAIFGTDSESLDLAAAAVAAGHEIVWCGDFSASTNRAGHPWLAQEDLSDDWEELLDQSACDGVIVGRGSQPPALRAEQVNQLAKNGIAVLATFPLVDSVLQYYEIDMSRSESEAILLHFNPLVQQAELIEQWAQWVHQGHPKIGVIEQVVWERPLSERTRANVIWHFARDVELLDRIASRLNRLGAHGSPDEAATYSGLSVQLLGESKTPVRWEVGPIDRSGRPRLSLVGQQGKFSAEFNETGQAVQTQLNYAGQTQTSPIEAAHVAALAIDRFAEAVKSADSNSSTWPNALHAMELADTIELSLHRGRMIDIHNQQLTEELAFKGTMSAAGCGVLMVLPPLLLAVGWLAEQIGLPVASYWPHCLLALLLLFLVFQVISKLLLKPSSANSKTSAETADE